MKKVSIIIPTYNCLAFLPKAVESVFSQSHQDFELIIINDNSSDDTENYLNNLTDERIKVITTGGVGASQARNLGIAESCGDYIAFLDADDFWLPEKLSLQLKLHETNPTVAMSFTNYDHLTEEYQSIVDCFAYWNQFQGDNSPYIHLEHPLNFIIKNNIIGTSTVMINADVLPKIRMFDADIKYAEDWELWLRICEEYDVAALNSVQVGYLMRQSSITQTDSLRLRNLQCIESILNRYQNESQRWDLSPSSFKNARARVLEGYADYHRGLQHYKQAIAFGLRSLILVPELRRVRSLLGDCSKALYLSK